METQQYTAKPSCSTHPLSVGRPVLSGERVQGPPPPPQKGCKVLLKWWVDSRLRTLQDRGITIGGNTMETLTNTKIQPWSGGEDHPNKKYTPHHTQPHPPMVGKTGGDDYGEDYQDEDQNQYREVDSWRYRQQSTELVALSSSNNCTDDDEDSMILPMMREEKMTMSHTTNVNRGGWITKKTNQHTSPSES